MFQLDDIQGLDSLKKEIVTLISGKQFPHTSLFLDSLIIAITNLPVLI